MISTGMWLDIVTVIITFFMFIIVIITHEFGHYICFRLLGFKVGLHLNKLGDLEIGRSVHNKITLLKSLPVSIGGVALGLLPFYFIKFLVTPSLYMLLFMAYFFLCFGDLQTIAHILNAKDKNVTLMQWNVGLWKSYVDEMNNSGENIGYDGKPKQNL